MPALIAAWMLARVYSPPVQLTLGAGPQGVGLAAGCAAETCWPVAVLVHVVVPLTVLVVQPGGAQSWLPEL